MDVTTNDSSPDLNENEHPWDGGGDGTYVGFYEPNYAGLGGQFTAAQLRYIADFMDSGKAIFRPDPLLTRTS